MRIYQKINSNYLLKSGVNFNEFFTILFLLMIVNILVKGNIYVIILTIILLYLLSLFLVNGYYFYDSEVKIVFYFRVYKRIKIISFNDIKRIEYRNYVGQYNFPRIVIITKNNDNQKYRIQANPNNSFTHWSYKKRKQILLFLANKGLPVEVYSDFKRDHEILEEIKKIQENKRK